MSDLAVDTTALRTAAAELRRAAEFAAEAKDRGGRLRDLGPGAAGEAARAVEDFLREWSYGLGIVGEDALTLANALDGAAAAFEAVEAGLTGELTGELP